MLLQELKPFLKRFQITGEDAGLHLLLSLQDGSASEQELVWRAKENGVRVYAFSDAQVAERAETGNPTVILGYGGLSEEQILEGIAKLKQVWL